MPRISDERTKRYASKKALLAFIQDCGGRGNLSFQTICERTGWQGGKLRRLIRGEQKSLTILDAVALQRAIEAESLDRIAYALNHRRAVVENRARERAAAQAAIDAALME
jgi:hypothetical protein